jgi:hypothetical protein
VARTEADLVRLEAIARRFVLSQLESVRDDRWSREVAFHTMSELLRPGQEVLDEDWMEVIWFLSFFAAAGALGEYKTPEAAIASVQERLAYLAGLMDENS